MRSVTARRWPGLSSAPAGCAHPADDDSLIPHGVPSWPILAVVNVG